MAPLYGSHVEDLKKSGLSDEMIAAMRIESHSRAGLASILERDNLANDETGYTIPYLTPVGQPTKHLNVRLMKGVSRSDKPDKRIKYLKPPASPCQLYWPPGCYSRIQQQGHTSVSGGAKKPDPIEGERYCIITEGEKKAAKAVQEGFPCVAVAGVYNWMDSDARKAEKEAGEGVSFKTKPLKELLELAKNTKLILLFDSDADNNGDVRNALFTLRDSLLFHGADWVRVISMPLYTSAAAGGPETAQKVGLDDLLQDPDGPAQLRHTLNEALAHDGTVMSPLAKIRYGKSSTGQDLHYIIPNSTPSNSSERHIIWKECEQSVDDTYQISLKIVASTRIWCTRVIVDIKDSRRWYEAAFVPLTERSPQYRIGDSRLLNPNGKDDGFADYGASILQKERTTIAEVLHACQSSGFAKTVSGTRARGWVEANDSVGAPVFVMPHGVITDAGFISRENRRCTLVPISCEAEGEYLARALRMRGDAKHGAMTLYAHVLCHPLPALMCSAAVAGLLRHAISDSENFVVHLFGASSGGKTIALRAAASLFGAPNDLLKPWRTTDNGLEATLIACNDFAVFLDESGQQENEEVLKNSAYLIGNGGQKSRASREGGARKAEKFRVIALSTGEHALLKGSINGGQEARVLQLPTDLAGPMWGQVDGEAMECLHRNLDLHCGWALEPLVKSILRSGSTGKQSLNEELDKYLAGYRSALGSQASSIAKRRSKHFALLTLAYRLLLSVCMEIVEERNPTHFVQSRLQAFIETVKTRMLVLQSDQFGEGESMTLIRHLYEQVERHHFKIDGMTETEKMSERWGYLRGDHLGLIPCTYDDLIKPYDRTRMLNALDQAGLLIHTPGKKRKDLKHSMRINGSSMYLFVVDYKKLKKLAG